MWKRRFDVLAACGNGQLAEETGAFSRERDCKMCDAEVIGSRSYQLPKVGGRSSVSAQSVTGTGKR